MIEGPVVDRMMRKYVVLLVVGQGIKKVPCHHFPGLRHVIKVFSIKLCVGECKVQVVSQAKPEHDIGYRGASGLVCLDENDVFDWLASWNCRRGGLRKLGFQVDV